MTELCRHQYSFFSINPEGWKCLECNAMTEYKREIPKLYDGQDESLWSAENHLANILENLDYLIIYHVWENDKCQNKVIQSIKHHVLMAWDKTQIEHDYIEEIIPLTWDKSK